MLINGEIIFSDSAEFGLSENISDGELMAVLLIIFLTPVSLKIC